MAKNRNNNTENLDNPEIDSQDNVSSDTTLEDKSGSEVRQKTEYIVKDIDINHSGKLYKEGSIICLTDKEAETLKNYLKKSEVENG